MENRICFLFGNSTAPYDTISLIKAVAERHYLDYGIRTFVVGNRGDFDGYAATAIKSLKQRFPDISLALLLPYHPGERPIALPDGFDCSFYPPLENIPRRYAIVKANKYMIDTADTVICFAKFVGNSKKLLEYALKKQKTNEIIIENIAEQFHIQ